MLDDILGIVFELILDGVVEAINWKKVPMPVRVILSVVILVLVLGVCGFLIGNGINTGKVALIILGVVLLIVFTALAIYEIKQQDR